VARRTCTNFTCNRFLKRTRPISIAPSFRRKTARTRFSKTVYASYGNSLWQHWVKLLTPPQQVLRQVLRRGQAQHNNRRLEIQFQDRQHW
jgi:hypothetical protein